MLTFARLFENFILLSWVDNDDFVSRREEVALLKVSFYGDVLYSSGFPVDCWEFGDDIPDIRSVFFFLFFALPLSFF